MSARTKTAAKADPQKYPTILIVDQSIELLMNFAPTLRKCLGENYHFKMTHRPEQALSYAEDSHTVLLIADLRLLLKTEPQLFLQQLRERAPKVRVILGTPINLRHGSIDTLNADGLIEHPFDLDHLMRLAKQYLPQVAA